MWSRKYIVTILLQYERNINIISRDYFFKFSALPLVHFTSYFRNWECKVFVLNSTCDLGVLNIEPGINYATISNVVLLKKNATFKCFCHFLDLQFICD